jgi:hypothetical protein
MSALQTRVALAYDELTRITTARIPYVYGGGHNATFTPDPGYDCSGLLSRVLHVAGLLGDPRVLFPEATEALEAWGEPGPGGWMTVWDRDVPVQHHCFLEFHLPAPRTHRFAQAPHTGELVGWLDPNGVPWVIDTTGFNARHWAGA